MTNKVLKTIICMVASWCCAQCVALAGTVLPDDMRQLCAEYVAVKYTDAYVRSLDNEDTKRYIERYCNVEKWTLDDQEHFAEYYEWFKDENNKFQRTFSQLTNVIWKRRESDLDKLLTLSTETFRSACEGRKDQLKAEIEEMIGEKIQNSSEVISRNTQSFGSVSPQRNDYLKVQYNKTELQNLIWIAIGLGVLNLVLLTFVFIKRSYSKQGLRDSIIDVVMHSKRLEEYFARFVSTGTNVSNRNPNFDYSRVQRLEERFFSLEKEIDQLKLSNNHSQRAENIQKPASAPIINQPTIVAPQPSAKDPVKAPMPVPKPDVPQSVCFVRNYGDGKLRKCDESRAQYKVLVPNAGVAKLVFCGDLDKARDNSDSTFDGICQWEGVDIKVAKNVETITPGEVESESEGTIWRVVKKAVIKFS